MSEQNFMTLRRKLVIASWTRPTEANIFGKISVDVTNALRYIEHLREVEGVKVTISHLIGKALALALKQMPGLNGRLLFGSFIPHETVDITYLVALEDDGGNLSKAKIDNTDQKSVVEIAQELHALAARTREGKDENFKKGMGPLKSLPTWLIRPLLYITGWLTGCLGVEIKAFGLERFPFGSAVVTNVGMFGLDEGYAPQTPFARVPLWVAVGSITKQAVVVDDKIEILPMLPLMATIDHRFVDGQHIAVLVRVTRECLAKPWTLDGLDAAPWE